MAGAAIGDVSAKGRGHAEGPETEGPCGNGKRKDNQCTKDSQCCTGICDIDLGKKNKDKKGRCRCLKNGKPCSDDRNCCKTSVCYEGSCVDCRKKNQACDETSDCCGTNVCPNGSCVPCKASNQTCSTAADCCSGLGCFDGTCAACAAAGKACSSDDQCCSGASCLNGTCATCIPDGGSCVSTPVYEGNGKQAKGASLSCCAGSACFNNVCATAKTVKNGEACVDGLDTCEDPEAACMAYEFSDPDGTYCLLPRKAACRADLDCWSRDCENFVCIACSDEVCITPCSPVVCKTGCTYTKVQDAINAAPADTVVDIGPGEYNEDLVVTKNITLRACKGETVILRNKNLDTRTIEVTNMSTLQLIDIIVDGRSDLENGRYGGGIATYGFIYLLRNTVIQNGAWDYGGAILLGSPTKNFTPTSVPEITSWDSLPKSFAAKADRTFARSGTRRSGGIAPSGVKGAPARRLRLSSLTRPSSGSTALSTMAAQSSPVSKASPTS